MKISLKRIALSLLLAFGAIVLCVFGNSLFKNESTEVAEAAGTATTAVITADKEMVGPGEQVTIKVTLTSTYSASDSWGAVSFVFGEVEIDERGRVNGVAKNAKYLSYVSHTHNLTGYRDNSNYVASDPTEANVGMTIDLSFVSGTKVPATKPVEISVTLKVADDAGSIGKLVFGIGRAGGNSLSYEMSSGARVSETFAKIVPNTVEIKLGTVSSDNTLKSVQVGHASASTSVDIAEAMIYNDTGEATVITNRTNFKVKAEVNDSSAEIKYGVGATAASATPTTAVANKTEFTITLDTSGETVVVFLITAENGTTKNYTLTIKSSYARINTMTVAVNRPAGADTVNGLGYFDPTAFNKDTFAYSIKATDDCTSVDITPTVVADYGINTEIAVATTGCTAANKVNSGSALNVTGITNNATVTLTVKAKDGTTTQAYTLTFTAANTNASLSSFTMTEDVTGNSVSNDAAKATAAGKDYYFLLSGGSGFKGKFVIDAAESTATIKVNNTNYNKTSEVSRAAGNYTVTVTAPAGNPHTYNVTVAADIKKGEITDLQYALNSATGSYTTLAAESSEDVGTTSTYTYNIKIDVNDYPANTTKLFLKGNIAAGSTVTKPSAWTGTSGTVTSTDGSWNKALTYGKNELTLEASTTEGKSIYKITINLVEDKNSIKAVSITNSKGNNIPSDLFSFSDSTYVYDITVPYADYDKVNFSITTDGKYTSVYRENGTANTKLSHTANTFTHSLGNQQLSSGDTVVFSFHAQADDTLGDVGPTYTFSITRTLADTDATLTALSITIDGETKDIGFKEGVAAYSIDIERPDTNPTSSPVIISATAKSSTSQLKIAVNNATATAMTKSDTMYTSSQTFTYQSGEHSTDYKVTVTSESGSSTTYVITVKKIVPEPEFTDLQISYINSSSYESVLLSGEYNTATGTYTVTKNIADVPVNSTVYLKGTTTKEASVTKSSNLNGASSPWSGSLAHGENTFTLTVSATNKTSKTYKIVINLLENKRDIENVTITFNGIDVDANFTFSPSTTTYNLSVPYAMQVPTKTDPAPVASVVITVTTNGYYTVIFDEKNNKFDTTDSVKTSTMSISLNAGRTTSISFHAYADKKIAGLPATSIGSLYTFNIERASADTDATLSSLDVTVDGTAITFAEGMFDPDTRTYNYTIPSTGNSTAALVFTAVAKSDKSTLKFAVNSATATLMTNGVSNQTFTFRDANYTETYKIVVIPESGEANKLEYQVLIKRVLQKGDFDEIKISTDNMFFDALKDASTSKFDASGAFTQDYNISDVPVGSKIYFEAKETADSTVSVTGLTKNGDKYEVTLSKFGATTVKLTATSKSGKTDYVITLNLVEENDDISDVTISGVDDFTFNQFTTSYDIKVPFAVSNVTLTVKPDGTYTVIKKQGTTADAVLTKNGTNYEEKVSLRAGDTTTVVIYGVANEGRGKSDGTAKGTAYTFNIERGEADPGKTLDELTVKIDGKVMPIDFDPGTNEYTIEIEKPDGQSSSSIDITATPTSQTSTVTGTGTKTFAYKDNQEHETPYVITVKAQNGETANYTVTVKRVIIPGDFATLEFAETGTNYKNVFTSSEYDKDELTYTLNLDVTKVSAGSTVRIKAIPTSGATVTMTGDIKDSASANIYLATISQGRNEYTMTATTATGTKTYTFVLNLFEDKNKIEKIELSADGLPLSSDVFRFVESQKSYTVTVPYTVKSVKFNVTTDGQSTVVLDEDDNAFAKLATGNGRHHERTIELPEGRVTTVMFRAKSDKDEEGEWYEFLITREGANSDATLKSLGVTVGGRPMAFEQGEFDPEVTDYTIMVDESPSYDVTITAVPNVASTQVSGAGKKTFNLSETTSTMANFPITTTAEDGTTRTYNVTISQKPIVLSSNYDIRRIVINGTRDYYDDVPSNYNSDEPVKITVPYTQNRVKVVVTTAVNATVVTEPTLSANGYLDLPEDSTVTLVVYAVAEDGTNASGLYQYVFEITREKQGEVSGPDATITLSNKIDTNKYYDIDIDTEEALVHVVGTYNHKIDKVDITVDLLYGGDFEIIRVDSQSTEVVVPKVKSGRTAKIKLDYGTNVFNITMYSSDGYTKKTVIFVFERERASLLGLSASGIATLRDDFDPAKDDYSYNVSSDVDYLGLVVDIDKDMYTYEFKGSEQLNYGANQVIIEIYENSSESMGRAASTPVRTITINVTREKSNLFWFIMFWVLVALVVLELIIILLVRRNKNNGGHDEPTIIMTGPAAAPALPAPQPAPQIQPIIIQAPPPQQPQLPQPAQLPQQGQTTVYITPHDPNNPQY